MRSFVLQQPVRVSCVCVNRAPASSGQFLDRSEDRAAQSRGADRSYLSFYKLYPECKKEEATRTIVLLMQTVTSLISHVRYLILTHAHV